MTDDPKLTFQGTYFGIVTVVTHLLSFFQYAGLMSLRHCSNGCSMRQNVSMVSFS